MEVYRDFKELLELFNANGVEYMIVGGYAMAYHGAPRYTRDIDLYVRPTIDNARHLVAALTEFGFGQGNLQPEDFNKPDQVVQLGRPPVRVDLITSIDGISWEQAASRCCRGEYGGTPTDFIGREDLIANKKAAGRPKDLLDAKTLEDNS